MQAEDSFIYDLAHATEQAAIASYDWIGRGDEKAADKAAVDAMRNALNIIPMKGRIVIGEGERDEAPMLYIGEEVGTQEGPRTDIALDPLEGTTITATGAAGAMTVISACRDGHLLFSPDVYMEKLVIGLPKMPQDISINNDIKDNIKALSRATGKPVTDLTICLLDRPRHQDKIESIRSLGARIALIGDGDIAAGIMVALNKGVDMYVGMGGAPEGVLKASILQCLGGSMEGKLVFRNDEERARATKCGISDFDRIYKTNDLAQGQIFCALTGVTTGPILEGVQKDDTYIATQTLIMTSQSKFIRHINTKRPK